MTMEKRLKEYGIIPVITIDDENDAPALAEALCAGGLECAEVTFRTDAAKNAISLMKKTREEMLIIAGTVLSCSQADEAMEAGAEMIVAPGLNVELAKYCKEKNYPYIPGICTPSEIELALSLGYDTVKFFPAELSGGIDMLKAFHGPYHEVRFMPTGGINMSNAKDYLLNDFVLCVGGTWIAREKMIEDKEFERIARNAIEASELVKTIR